MKLVLVAGLDKSLANFRGALIRSVATLGHKVVAIAPDQNDQRCKIEQLGARFAPIELSRAGFNPLADWKSYVSLVDVLLRERPDLILAYTIKPIVYGIPAAAKAGVPHRYALITGLGAAFYTKGIKGSVMRFAATWLYRRALRQCTKIIVQNDDIALLMVARSIVADRSRMIVVSGSGVDTEHFGVSPAPCGSFVCLLLARMLRDKGIEEYVAAARLVKKHLPHARFLLLGDTDPNPAAISAQQLEKWNQEGVVEYSVSVADVRPLLSACSVYVLPSYHEGLPRSVLEAMATGRPVITTDTIGCRDTIINPGTADSERIRTGDNGLLVPVKTVEPLAAAMLRLARDPVLCAHMGRRGREIVEERFDVRKINEQMMQVMGLTGDKT